MRIRRVILGLLALGFIATATSAAPLPRVATPGALAAQATPWLVSADWLWAEALRLDRAARVPLVREQEEAQRVFVLQVRAAAERHWQAMRLDTPLMREAAFDSLTDLACLARLYNPTDEGLLSFAKSVETRLGAFSAAIEAGLVPDYITWPETAATPGARARLFAAWTAPDTATPHGAWQVAWWLHLLETEPALRASWQRLQATSVWRWGEPGDPLAAWRAEWAQEPLARLEDLAAAELPARLGAWRHERVPLLPRGLGGLSDLVAPLAAAHIPIHGELMAALATGEASRLLHFDAASLTGEYGAVFEALARYQERAFPDGAAEAWLLPGGAAGLPPALGLALLTIALSEEAAPAPRRVPESFAPAIEAAPERYRAAVAYFSARSRQLAHAAPASQAAAREAELSAAFSALATSSETAAPLGAWPAAADVLRRAVYADLELPWRERLVWRIMSGPAGQEARVRVGGGVWLTQTIRQGSADFMTLRAVYGETVAPLHDAAAPLAVPASLSLEP